MNNRFSLLARASVAAFLLTGLFSCKENTILNANVLPAGDSLNTITLPDTFTVEARTVYVDSAITSYQRLIAATKKIVGSAFMGAGTVTSDPFFGKTYEAIAFQPASVTANFTFGNNSRIDSAVLVLPYSGFTWGDTTAAPGIHYRVYRLGENLSGVDSVIYSSREPGVDRSVVLGEKTVYFADLKDSVSVGGSRKSPHLRIPLNLSALLPALNEGIQNSATLAGFVSAFRGLYLEPDGSQSGSIIPYYSFLSGNDLYEKPGIVVYYGNDGNANTVASFPFQSSYGKVYTYVRRDYTGTPAYNYVSGSSSVNSDLLLLQNAPGAAIDFKMPYAKALPKGVYSRAQLLITSIDTVSANLYFPPARIFPERVNADGTLSSIADRLPEGSSESANFVDGSLRTTTIGGVTIKQYLINFPRELQRVVNSSQDALHLRIGGISGLPGAFRLIAGNRSHPLHRIQLRISYTQN